MPDSDAFPLLFSPLAVGRRTVRNRVCLPATLTNYAAGHRVTERWIQFLAERARGGAGLLVSEIIAVDPDALAHGGIVAGYLDENETGFKRTAELVERAGACLVAQLWHPGRQQLWSPVASPKGVSDQPDALSWTVPHVMSTADVRKVAEEYVEVARRMHRCGFGGVELHGAHGYLITQFLSPWSNTRTDDYGGSLANRVRFVVEVAGAIRQACGPEFVIGLKMPGTEGVAGGIDPDEAARITAELAPTGLIDYFAYSQGNFSLSLETHVPDMHFRPGHFLDIHKRIRPAAAGIPVMAMGRIATPAQAEAALADGACDLVGMSRALIADAAWPEKARRGRSADIRPSTFDNIAWGEIHAGRPLEEFLNPLLGREGEAAGQIGKAAAARKVVVVGAGPAGIQAACTAGARGHRVTLIAASGAIGGKLRMEAGLPGRQAYGDLLAWWERELARLGVTVRTGERIVDAAGLKPYEPDVVVVATGAEPRPPEGFGGPGQSIREWLAGRRPAQQGATAVLLDMDHGAATYAAAEALAAHYRRVVLMTPRSQIARNVNYCSAIGVQRRLYQADIDIVIAAEPVSLADRRLTWRNVFSGKAASLDDVDLLVWSTPRRAADGLAHALQAAGIDTRLAGDCMSPRNTLCAAHEGHSVAMNL